MAFQDPAIQRSIKSDIIVRKLKVREPENPIRFAYAKLLREQAKSKQFFPDINPYAEVYQFRENIFGIYTYSLDGGGDAWCFLIDGPEKALLIDTSFGLGDLKGLVEKLIGKEKPYFVANTHSHGDHSRGNFQFDTVYCHEYEKPLLEMMMTPHAWDGLFNENGVCEWAEFDKNDLIEFKKYNVIGVPDGYVFNLGGDYEVELIFLPGHSCGHCGFLDKKNRVFFPGDDCCVGAVGVGGPRPGAPYGEYFTVEALTKELKKVIARMDEFDSLFPSHGPVETGPIMLVSLLETCEEVLADPTKYDFSELRERNGVMNIQYGRRIFESGYLNYNKNSVYMNAVAEIE